MPPRSIPLAFACAGALALAACADTTDTLTVDGRDFTVTVQPEENLTFGGTSTYVDENGIEQEVFFDGFIVHNPITVVPVDGLALDPAGIDAARAAGARACADFGTLSDGQHVVLIEDAAGQITGIVLNGCVATGE